MTQYSSDDQGLPVSATGTTIVVGPAEAGDADCVVFGVGVVVVVGAGGMVVVVTDPVVAATTTVHSLFELLPVSVVVENDPPCGRYDVP